MANAFQRILWRTRKMAKNNKLINSLAEVARRNRDQNIKEASERDTLQIYSALAIALWNMLDLPVGEKADAIEQIFAESQEVWIDCVNKGKDIEQLCFEKTGISIRGNSDE